MEAKQNIPRKGFVQQHRADTRGEGQPKGAFSVQMAKDDMAVDAQKDALKKQDRMRNFISKLGSAMFRTKRRAHLQKMKAAGIADAKESNMKGYERLYEMILGEGKMQSRDYPGHEGRMKGHMARIQNDPRFEEPDPKAKARGAKGAQKTNKKGKSQSRGSNPQEYGDFGGETRGETRR